MTKGTGVTKGLMCRATLATEARVDIFEQHTHVHTTQPTITGIPDY